MTLLKIHKLTKDFGGLRAINNLDFELNTKDVLGLIGPNGAGKSTTVNVISGIYGPNEGAIIFNNRDITFFKPHQVAQLGIGRTFQLVSVFGNLTVLENVFLAGQRGYGLSFWDGIFPTLKKRKSERQLWGKAQELLNVLGIYEISNEFAGKIPLGFQRLLALAIALIGEPKLLLLDETFSGLSAAEIRQLMKILENLREQGMSMLLIEHNMNVVMNICNKVVVINFGEKIAEGSPEEIQNDPVVIEAYLGTK